MTSQPLRVNRPALLSFFNEGLAEAKGHHTALTGMLGEPLAVALLLHYLNRNGGQAHCVSTKVTTGKKKGNWLDAWIDDGNGTLYQTEIKMWAGNAIGGLKLKLDADAGTLLAGGLRQWAGIWDSEKQIFKDMKVGKVLTPMQKPQGYESACVEPLACFWWMLQQPGGSEPWFTVPTSDASFKEVHIFSLTAYLLSLSDETLHLDMPLLSQRLTLLERLFQR
ncbi:hypothetical protein [Deinococcus arenicola]|uniref:Restriction endonuclease n=1 Tax=Deinococcus arenicola TaxID=2994950 RepID=A0ABU4DR10_9DEIO|nr:hypothetical protein [Deinococcus sp. ZS9-10]MDV6374134.1 hypothetical protein [Deinococcus sp. ZS9-10]